MNKLLSEWAKERVNILQKNEPISLLCQNDSDSDDDDDDDGGANTEWRDDYNRVICNRKYGQNKQHVVPMTETDMRYVHSVSC